MVLQGISALTARSVKIEIDGGVIRQVSETQSIQDASYISPAFFDAQVNGYRGSDYSLDDFSESHLNSIIYHLAVAGTTQHLPTIVTRPQEKILRTLSVLKKAIEADPAIASAIPGIHIEGPYISAEPGPRGAHDPKYVRDPEIEEFEDWQQASGDRIAMVTLAPERKGAFEFIEHLHESGVVAAIGHTAADADTIKQAINSGARISTHLGNGSHSLIPRLNNYIWEQLAADKLMASFITDSYHLPPSVVNVIVRTKGLERLILVSDVTLPGGYDPGSYKWGNIDVTVFDDGHLGVTGTDLLAGASHLLDWDIPRFMEYTGLGLAETLPLCTTNPARLFNLEKQYGHLEKGAPANIAVFRYHKGDDRLDIERVIREGIEVYSRSAA